MELRRPNSSNFRIKKKTDPAGRRGLIVISSFHNLNFSGHHFPALSFDTIIVGVSLDSYSAGNSDSLSFFDLVQASNLLTFPGADLEPAAVNYDSCRSFVSCFGAYGETSDSCVSDGGYLH